MGSSQADKAASHQRIVTAAAARVRRAGVDGLSVADLMREAGLTHGGFYRHFGSRDDLVAEAVEAALAHGSRRAEAAARPGGPEALAATIDAYLSPLHRDKPETGCAVAALPADIARSGQRARAAYTAQVRRYLDLLAGLTPAGEPDDPPSSWRRWSERSRWLVPSTIPGSPTRSWSGSPECCTATFRASAHHPAPSGSLMTPAYRAPRRVPRSVMPRSDRKTRPVRHN